MIQSKYMTGVTVPSFDGAISEFADSYAIDGGGKPMKVAIQNFDGKVYRVLTTVGLGAYMHATSSLLDLGPWTLG